MYLADQLGALTTTRGMASDLGSNWMAAGNLDFSRSYLESIDQITPADVQRVAQTYLVEKSLNIVSLNPRGSLTKTRGTRGNLSSTEVQRHVFENGLTLLVKEDSRLPIVHLHAALRGGLLAESDAKNGLGRLMARTLIKGAAGRDGETIMESIESRGGSLGADSGANSFSCSATVLARAATSRATALTRRASTFSRSPWPLVSMACSSASTPPASTAASRPRTRNASTSSIAALTPSPASTCSRAR